jgi:hypothetical protein
MFGGVNETFATAAVEGALTMAAKSIDFEVVRDAAVSSGGDILPAGPDVQKSTCAVVKNWWHSFG